MPLSKPAILFFDDPGQKLLGPKMSLEVAADGWAFYYEQNLPTAIELLNSKKFGALVSNSPSVALFSAARTANPKIINILLTEKSMPTYAAELEVRDVELVDHIIAHLTTEWALSDLSVTLQKIVRGDYFGLEKYLALGSVINSIVIKGSSNRESSNAAVSAWVDSIGLNKNISRLAFGISEELIMNAIFDAPTAGGRTTYGALSRSQVRELESDDCPTLRYGADDRMLGISITDPFGAFARDTWFAYARKVLRRRDNNLIDLKSGGAGLGLFKILFGSHSIICNVQPKKATEVIVLILTNQPIRDFDHMPRSIHYFGTESHSLKS
jgi:hypothetical protein